MELKGNDKKGHIAHLSHLEKYLKIFAIYLLVNFDSLLWHHFTSGGHFSLHPCNLNFSNFEVLEKIFKDFSYITHIKMGFPSCGSTRPPEAMI
jgi:hypothetical protein